MLFDVKLNFPSFSIQDNSFYDKKTNSKLKLVSSDAALSKPVCYIRPSKNK